MALVGEQELLYQSILAYISTSVSGN